MASNIPENTDQELELATGRIEIRIATAEDIPAVSTITREAFEQYARLLAQTNPTAARVAALSETEESVRRALSDKCVFIGFVDGEPLGSVRAEMLGNVGYISRFGVRTTSQNSGLGKFLLAAAEQWLLEQGAVATALHTSARMTGTIIFYYKCGYFIHSTSEAKGYTRGLLLHELVEDGLYLADLTGVHEK